MGDTDALLARARLRFDEPGGGLADAARRAATGGFSGGAEWLRLALANERGVPPEGRAAFARLGLLKYGLAAAAASLVGAVALAFDPLLLPLVVVAFYLVEVRMVFVFPLALDGHAAPLVGSHDLLQRTMPWPQATARVMRIAAEMLCGGLLGRGLLRSWCVGCLAVVLWYEEARRTARVAL